MSIFEKQVVAIIHSEKEKSFGTYKYYSALNNGVYITPITIDSYSDRLIRILMKWRQNGQHGFTKYFNVTFQSTKKWLDLLVQQRKDRLLFLVFDCEDQMIGHLGVSSFDFEKNTCEIDNVIRGEISNQNDVMFSAAAVLIEWINSNIKPHDINITVLYDNISALLLYHRLGFVPYKLEGLQKVEKNQEIEWVHKQHGKIDKFIIKMSLKYKTDKLHEKRN